MSGHLSKRNILLFITALLFIAVTAKAGDIGVENRIVYGWFPRDLNDWSTIAIDWSALTHICLRSIVLQPDGSIKPGWGCTTGKLQAYSQIHTQRGTWNFEPSGW